MSNNRNLEYRSLKGPKRKLKLILIDNHRYISKRDLQQYFFNDGWTIKDFQYHFGIGHRIVRDSLYKWYTKEEIDKSHRTKIAEKQLGDNNSNKVNWYRPRKLLPLYDLVEGISHSKNKKDLQKNLNLTSFELSSLQQYYNLKLPEHYKVIENLENKLSKGQIGLLVKLAEVFNISQDLFSNDGDKVAKGLETLVYNYYETRIILRKLRRYIRRLDWVSETNMPTNSVEYVFLKALYQLGIPVKAQYYFKQFNIRVDFLLLDRPIIIELDGNMHDIHQDKVRDKSLNNLGYTVIRINLKKELGKSLPTIKQAKLCLKKYL